jgi:hypothetical protein
VISSATTMISDIGRRSYLRATALVTRSIAWTNATTRSTIGVNCALTTKRDLIAVHGKLDRCALPRRIILIESDADWRGISSLDRRHLLRICGSRLKSDQPEGDHRDNESKKRIAHSNLL